MNARWVLTLVGFALGAVGGASGQEILYLDPHVSGGRVGGEQFVLTPANTQVVGGDPLFLGENPRTGTTDPSAPPVQVGGVVGGNTIFDAATLPAIFPRNLRVDIGFDYIRPDFPGRSVSLIVPGGVNGNFSSLGGSGDVSYDFAFVPKVSVDYQFQDLGFGVTASGKLIGLTGHLTRTIDSGAGSANLTATSTISYAVANLIEGSIDIPLKQYSCFEDSCLQDTLLQGTLGTQYAHLAQDYTANLTSGGTGSTATAHQDWDGLGLTTSLSFLHPLPRDFFLYGVSRGSFLLGSNNRNSIVSVVVSGGGAGSTSTKLTENKSVFAPVGDFEFGVAWGKPLAPKQDGEAPRVVKSGPLFWVKAGLVADIWGGLGVLSAPDNAQGFSDSRLLLYGFSVVAGVNF